MKNSKPGDEFVLPLPALSIKDLLPSADVDIRDLFASDESLSTLRDSESLCSLSATSDNTHEFVATAASRGVTSEAKAFLFTPEAVSLEQRRSWQAISEIEWHQLHQVLQLKIPSIDAVCVLLGDCHSDALARFVWESLLVPILEALTASSSQPQDRDTRAQELFDLLLRQNCFRAMAPKEFRASVRAKRFREQLSDGAFGASVELQLLALYHSNRQNDWPA